MLNEMLYEFPLIVGGAIFFLGLCLGSFSSALSYRVPLKISWAWEKNEQTGRLVAVRSMCPNCNTTLQTKDLIPILSWCLSKGKCRHCSFSISIRYPMQELCFAILATVLWIGLGAQSPSLMLATIIATPFIYTFVLSAFHHKFMSWEMLCATLCVYACAFTFAIF
jgi:prepilin signal peptidase PulO-like enzyme (type II secretory pathway)